jgi:hypothetical protein
MRHLSWLLPVLTLTLLLTVPRDLHAEKPSANPITGTIKEVFSDKVLIKAFYDGRDWDCVPYQNKWIIMVDGKQRTLADLQALQKQLKPEKTKFSWEDAKGHTVYATKIEAFTK